MTDIGIGFIPSGSGNAHLKNLCERANEKCSLETAIYFLAKGKTINIDMTVIQGERIPNKVFSFLSVVWTMIADVDLESEL